MRAYAVIELTKYGLSLTPEVLSSFQDSVNEAQYDKYANLLYSANYIPDAMLEVLNQAIQVDEYSPGFIFDAKSNTCSYSWIVSGTTSDKLDLVTDYTGITNNVSKVNGTLLPFFHAIHIAPDILCTLYTRDGERFLEYNNDTQTYKHPLMGTKSTHSSYTPRPSSGSSTTFHSKDRSMDAWVCAKMYVETNLKSPSTAKFCKYPDATIMRIGEDEYIVRGYVDAENSFGATVRQYWTVDLFLTEKGFRDPYLEFD